MTPSLETLLSPHYVGTDYVSGVHCYVLSNPRVFFFRNKWAGELLKQCEFVQESIWRKKYSTYQNTFAQGFLLLYIAGGQVKGFVSASSFFCKDGTSLFYFSDVMLAPKIQGLGLSSLGLAVLHNAMLREAEILEPNGPFLDVMISGHIGCLKLFHNMPCFSKIKVDFHSGTGREILDYLRHDFPTQTIDDSGVMRNAWLSQCSKTDVWPNELISTLDLPRNVDAGNGDAVCCFFNFDSGSACLEDFVNEQFSLSRVGHGK